MGCIRTGALGQFEGVLGALVGAWEEVCAQQEAAQKLEAELFRTKARSTTILTEEVRVARRHVALHVRVWMHGSHSQCTTLIGNTLGRHQHEALRASRRHYSTCMVLVGLLPSGLQLCVLVPAHACHRCTARAAQ